MLRDMQHVAYVESSQAMRQQCNSRVSRCTGCKPNLFKPNTNRSIYIHIFYFYLYRVSVFGGFAALEGRKEGPVARCRFALVWCALPGAVR